MKGLKNMRSFIRTYSGTDIDVGSTPEEMAKNIQVEDVAHHLSLMVRYNGGCPFLYSVAQHSLLVAELVPARLRLAALLHDAAEAYTGDLVSPLKHRLQDFRQVEALINEALEIRFGLSLDETDRKILKGADKVVEAAEMMQLLGWADIATWKIDRMAPPRLNIFERPWQLVKAEFLIRFSDFGGKSGIARATNHFLSPSL